LTKLRLPWGKAGLIYVFSGAGKIGFSVNFTNSRMINSDLQLWRAKEFSKGYHLYGVKQTMKTNGDTYEITTTTEHALTKFTDQCPEFNFGNMNTIFKIVKNPGMGTCTLVLSAMYPSQSYEQVMRISTNNNFYVGGEFTFFGEKHTVKCANQLNNFSCSIIDQNESTVATFSRGSVGAGFANAEVQAGVNVSFLVAILVSIYFFLNNN